MCRACQCGSRTRCADWPLVAGFAVRQLYTDQDEVLFEAARPVILNGIEDIVTRPDLADRAVFLTLEAIPEERRRPEAEFWAAFEAERGRLLGVLLDAVVEGLKRLPDTQLPKLPRMADFALWASACETAIWPAGTFWSAYCGNRDEAVEAVIDADPVAATVRAVMMERTEWTGTASDLLGALAEGSGGTHRQIQDLARQSARAYLGACAVPPRSCARSASRLSHEREGRARTRIIRVTSAGAETCTPESLRGASVHTVRHRPQPMPKNRLRTNDFVGTCRADGGQLTRTSRMANLNRSIASAPTLLKSDGSTAADGMDANCANSI
jgi:hypothetical protein